MSASSTEAQFIVWGADLSPYGPVNLPTLVSWIKAQRVTADTWIFADTDSGWHRAAEVAELQLLFQPKKSGSAAAAGVDSQALRQLRLLAGLSDEQLARFITFMEILPVPQAATVVKQGDRGDAMYVVLEGELRVRMNSGGKETLLATLKTGDFFGDISIFDHGPRSADVVANSRSVLLKISSAAFASMAKAAPDLATPFLLAIGRTLTARIRAGNKRQAEAGKFAGAFEAFAP